MNEQELSSLLRKVCEIPSDDNIRLIVSDAYEEMGRPERAELIRKQLPVKHHERDSEVDSILERNWELWHEQDTTLPNDLFLLDWRGNVYYRGFINRMFCRWEVLKKYVDVLFLRTPLTIINLQGKQPHLTDSGQYVWGTRTSCSAPSSSILPEQLFEEMRLLRDLKYDSKSRRCIFDTVSSGRTALYKACVNWGRKKVGFDGFYKSAVFPWFSIT